MQKEMQQKPNFSIARDHTQLNSKFMTSFDQNTWAFFAKSLIAIWIENLIKIYKKKQNISWHNFINFLLNSAWFTPHNSIMIHADFAQH